jgi:hypothetical protein
LQQFTGETVPVLLASAVVEGTPEEIVTFVVDETPRHRGEGGGRATE